MKDKAKAKRLTKVLAGLLVLLVSVVMICAIIIPHEAQRVASKPSEGRTATPVVVLPSETGEDREVRGIDWRYWQSVNPDIIGWITIPGTPIDYPIMQAHREDPTHYLNYDAYDSYNFYGCIYVDAGCSIESDNVIIFGHNMGYFDDSMFTSLTNYLDQNYLDGHQMVVIQTPEKVMPLSVRAAEEISPYGYEKRVEFDSNEELQEYYLGLWQRAPSRSAEPKDDELEQLFTLITCDSDGYTRAIVYAG